MVYWVSPDSKTVYLRWHVVGGIWLATTFDGTGITDNIADELRFALYDQGVSAYWTSVTSDSTQSTVTLYSSSVASDGTLTAQKQRDVRTFAGTDEYRTADLFVTTASSRTYVSWADVDDTALLAGKPSASANLLAVRTASSDAAHLALGTTPLGIAAGGMHATAVYSRPAANAAALAPDLVAETR